MVGWEAGSNEGADLKLGRDYYSIFMISTAELRQRMLDSGAFVPNFGDDPFAYAMPDGYQPWRNRIPQWETECTELIRRAELDVGSTPALVGNRKLTYGCS